MKKISIYIAIIGALLFLVPLLIMSFSVNVLLGTIIIGLILLGIGLGVNVYLDICE